MNLQLLTIALDGLTLSVSQTKSQNLDQSVASPLESVRLASTQTGNKTQSIEAALDDVAFSATQKSATEISSGHGFVMRDIRSVRQPLVLRILAERASRKKAASYPSRKPAKQIEVQAAKLVMDNGSEKAFAALMARWLAASPPVAALPGPDAQALFYAHVAQALERIRLEREQLDDEEAVLALLMT